MAKQNRDLQIINILYLDTGVEGSISKPEDTGNSKYYGRFIIETHYYLNFGKSLILRIVALC